MTNFTSTKLPWVEGFLANESYSQMTLSSYKRDLMTFESFLIRKMNNLPFQSISRETIESFKNYLRTPERMTAANSHAQQELSEQSINRILVTLRRYLTYLMDRDEPVPVLPGVIKLFRKVKKPSQVAELDELKKLIESPMKFEKDKLIALRNRAALETLFASGMRISELINLKRSQLDKSGRIFIQGKGKKQRFIYLTDRAKTHIDNYLKARADEMPYLFPASGMNAKDKNKHISPNYLQMKIKKYRELLGINVPTSAHSLRHGFATYLAEQGANPAAIQILLGHESLDTTTRYVHASDKYAEKTHKDFHPLKN